MRREHSGRRKRSGLTAPPALPPVGAHPRGGPISPAAKPCMSAGASLAIRTPLKSPGAPEFGVRHLQPHPPGRCVAGRLAGDSVSQHEHT